jgi:predicted amidophosphoribosyltransferase
MSMCPVCGYFMDYEPKDYNICPCCATEFGNDDAFSSHAELRQDWILKGMKWWFGEAPHDWNPQDQLARLGG